MQVFPASAPKPLAPVQSVPAQSYTPHYSVAVGLYSLSLAVIILASLSFLTFRSKQQIRANRAIALLQQQAKLERLYRIQNGSEDCRFKRPD